MTVAKYSDDRRLPPLTERRYRRPPSQYFENFRELARTKIMQVVVYVGRRKFQESKTGEEWSSEAQRL